MTATNPYCLECDLNNCLRCEEGYFFDEKGICRKCQKKYSNCLQCNETACLLCNSSFYLENGSCYECVKYDQNCVACDLKGCFRCRSGYSSIKDLVLTAESMTKTVLSVTQIDV